MKKRVFVIQLKLMREREKKNIFYLERGKQFSLDVKKVLFCKRIKKDCKFLCVVVAHCVNKISVTEKLCKNRCKPEGKTNNNIYLEFDLLIMLLILHTEDYCKARQGLYAKHNEKEEGKNRCNR